MSRAKRILPVLEMTEWAWTINDVLDQPEQELNAVMYMKALGEKMRRQKNNRKLDPNGMETI